MAAGARLVPLLAVAALLGAEMQAAHAEIRNSNTPLIRVRVGAGGGVGTVIYNAGVPAELGGLPGVTAAPSTTSTNSIPGGSGVFKVRIVTDTNARSGVPAPLTGTFSYDSTTPMSCTTPTTCGVTTINLSQISWNPRDGDTLNSVLRYDDSANQIFQVQTDNNPANGGTDTRHRNWYQFVYDNDSLLPAGTYEGTVTINGEAL